MELVNAGTMVDGVERAAQVMAQGFSGGASYAVLHPFHADRQPVAVPRTLAKVNGIIPNELDPNEVLDAHSDLTTCRTLLLLRRDMHYDMLSERSHAEKFRHVAARHNVGLWATRNEPARR